MTYVITGDCINDAACIDVCPVDCIQPLIVKGGSDTPDMLYINPNLCVDCNACAEICPVSAIYSDKELPSILSEYKAVNARYFQLQCDIK